MIQRADFWDTIARNVHVHRNDIERLEDHTIVLKDGPLLPVDAIVCGTGFVNEFPFFTSEQRVALGFSHPKTDDKTDKEWSALEADADKEVLERYPKLASPPQSGPLDPTLTKTSNRLYNCITPLTDQSIAFVGNVYAPNGFRTAEAQAIWTTALFDGVVKLPSQSAMRRNVAWVNAFMRRRYPTHGAGGNYMQYDMMGYIDRLLGEVELTGHLKGGWRDWVLPMVASDLRGTTKEYTEKYGWKEQRGAGQV
jgi:hypothetical protein